MDILVKVSSLLVNDEKFYKWLEERISQFGVAADFYTPISARYSS